MGYYGLEASCQVEEPALPSERVASVVQPRRALAMLLRRKPRRVVGFQTVFKKPIKEFMIRGLCLRADGGFELLWVFCGRGRMGSYWAAVMMEKGKGWELYLLENQNWFGGGEVGVWSRFWRGGRGARKERSTNVSQSIQIAGHTRPMTGGVLESVRAEGPRVSEAGIGQTTRSIGTAHAVANGNVSTSLSTLRVSSSAKRVEAGVSHGKCEWQPSHQTERVSVGIKRWDTRRLESWIGQRTEN